MWVTSGSVIVVLTAYCCRSGRQDDGELRTVDRLLAVVVLPDRDVDLLAALRSSSQTVWTHVCPAFATTGVEYQPSSERRAVRRNSSERCAEAGHVRRHREHRLRPGRASRCVPNSKLELIRWLPVASAVSRPLRVSHWPFFIPASTAWIPARRQRTLWSVSGLAFTRSTIWVAVVGASTRDRRPRASPVPAPTSATCAEPILACLGSIQARNDEDDARARNVVRP